MADPRPTVVELVAELAREGSISEDQAAAARARLETEAAARDVPWYIQPLLFAGAVLAAAMLSIGIAVGLDFEWDAGPLFAIGSLYLASALGLHVFARQQETGGFFEYLALTLSIGGHGFVLAGAFDWVEAPHREIAMFAAASLLGLLLYPFYRDALHRFGGCLLVLGLAKFAFPAEDLAGVLHGFVAVTCVVSAWLLTQSVEKPAVRPLAYASLAGLLLLVLPFSDRGLWFEDPELPHPWISSVVVSMALLWAMWWAYRRRSERSPPVLTAVIAVVIVGGLAALATPGIPAALFLIVLGHAALHWQVTAVGLAALPVFLWKYYYNLEIDFLEKSGVLVGSGVLLLFARWWLLSRSRSQLGSEVSAA